MQFQFFEYRKSTNLLADFIWSQPRRGRGLVKQLAAELGLASPQVSQFLSGRKVPTVDQAFRIAKFFHWTEIEKDYLITLIEFERAQFHEVKDYFSKRLDRLREDSRQLKTSVTDTVDLEDAVKARFYSSWIYSAVRLFCSIGDGRSYEEISAAFSEYEMDMESILNFLMENHLIKKEGLLYQLGLQKTFVAKGSPYLRSHHCNWRLRAIESCNFITDDEMIFSSPMSISKKGFTKFRKELQTFVKVLYSELTELGEAEEVVCLNIDFFRIVKR